MAELLQDAALAEAAALLLVPEAALLLELSLAQPARPALAASTAIAAIAATVICLIPASSSLPARSRELLSRTAGRVLRRPGQPSSKSLRPASRRPRRPAPDWVDVPLVRFLPDQCAIDPVAGDNHAVAREARMALMFLNGDGMRGGRAHYTIEGVPLVGERRTAPLYRFFSVRDEFPALYPVAEGGQPILGELYDVPMGPLNALLATEPTELELSIIELEDGELSFAMVLREAEH